MLILPRSYEDQVILSIVRDLDENEGLPNIDLLARDIVISCCLRSTGGLSKFRDECCTGLYSSHVIYSLYNSALSLLMHLQHPSTHELFTHICLQLSLLAKDFPLNAFVMQGLRVLTEISHAPVPAQAIPYLESLELTEADLCDVQITFVIPSRGEVYERVSGKEANKSRPLELGPLITKRSQLSISSGEKKP